MHLLRIFDIDELENMIQLGYVSARRHPHVPLMVYRYTDKCVDEGMWNHITMRCRDLVVDFEGEIVANCFVSNAQPNMRRVSIFLYQGQLRAVARGSFENEVVEKTRAIITDFHPEYNAALRILCGDSTVIAEIIDGDLVLVGTIANFELASGSQLWTPAMELSWPGAKITGTP